MTEHSGQENPAPDETGFESTCVNCGEVLDDLDGEDACLACLVDVDPRDSGQESPAEVYSCRDCGAWEPGHRDPGADRPTPRRLGLLHRHRLRLMAGVRMMKCRLFHDWSIWSKARPKSGYVNLHQTKECRRCGLVVERMC
jgi:hypothetical protein